MTEDSVDARVYKAKVEIIRIARGLGGIGLVGIESKLITISDELGDINSILGSQFMELKGKEEECES